MNTEKAPGLSEISLVLIAANEAVGIDELAKICQCPRLILNAS